MTNPQTADAEVVTTRLRELVQQLRRLQHINEDAARTWSGLTPSDISYNDGRAEAYAIAVAAIECILAS